MPSSVISTQYIRDQVTLVVDPKILKLRQDLYGSGVTYNTYISTSVIPPTVIFDDQLDQKVGDLGYIKGIRTYSGGILKGTDQKELNFIGAGVSVAGNRTTITIPSGFTSSSGGSLTVISNDGYYSGSIIEAVDFLNFTDMLTPGFPLPPYNPNAYNANDIELGYRWSINGESGGPLPPGQGVQIVLNLYPHTHRVATTSGLGHIIVGSGLSITTSGVLSVNALVTISGVVPIASGGTGQTTALAAFNALSPLTTRGDLLTRDATSNVRLAIGTVAKYLRSDGTDPSWHTLDFTDLVYTGLTTGQVLRATGTTGAAFGTLDLANSNAITGILSAANGGTGINNSTRTLTITNNPVELINTFGSAVQVTFAATGTVPIYNTLTAAGGRVTYWETGGKIGGDANLTWNAGSALLTVTGASTTTGATTTDSLNVGSATGANTGQILSTAVDGGTTSVLNVLTVTHNSSGAAANGFGADCAVNLKTSTTPDQNAFLIRTVWSTASHSGRKAKVNFFVYDTAARRVMDMEANGSAAMIGFLGAAAVVRQSVASAAPAGGTGATAGAYDTAAHRDALITLVNDMRTAGINLGLWS